VGDCLLFLVWALCFIGLLGLLDCYFGGVYKGFRSPIFSRIFPPETWTTLPITDDTLPIANPRCVGDSPGIFARPYIGIFRVRFSGISLGAGTELISVGALIYCVFLQFWVVLDPYFEVDFSLFWSRAL
jgi:hypothetical protein